MYAKILYPELVARVVFCECVKKFDLRRNFLQGKYLVEFDCG